MLQQVKSKEEYLKQFSFSEQQKTVEQELPKSKEEYYQQFTLTPSLSQTFISKTTFPTPEEAREKGLLKSPWEAYAPLKIGGKSIYEKLTSKREPLERMGELDFWKNLVTNLPPQAKGFFTDLAQRAGYPLPPSDVPMGQWIKPHKSVMEESKGKGEIVKEKGKTLLGLATYIPKLAAQFIADPVGILEKRPLDAIFLLSIVYPKIKAQFKDSVKLPKSLDEIKQTMPPTSGEPAMIQQAIDKSILTPKDIGEIAEIIKTLKPLGKEQKAMYGKEFAKRIQEAKIAGAVGGQAGFFKKLSKMKGEYEKLDVSTQFEALKSKIPQETIDAMFNTIDKNSFLLEGEKLNTGQGLQRILEGNLPQPAQLSLLDTVYGKDLVGAILKKRPILQRMATMGLEVANLPRSFMAGLLDLSFGLRQGAFPAPRYFKQFAASFVQQFKWFGSEKAYQAAMETIARDPYFKLARQGRVMFTELGKTMWKREERYASPLAEKIPILGTIGIRMTSRAYTAFANKFRMDIFKSMAKNFERMGYKLKDNIELLRSMGDFTNVVTGRGRLGKIEPAAVALNAFFFSPRLQSSRLGLLLGKYNPLNPLHYTMLPKPVRIEALKTWISFVSAGMTIVTAAKLAGAEVGANPLSADFGKIKIGNTRIDLWSGHQPIIRTTAQLFTGKTISTTTGRVTKTGEGYKPLTRLDILSRWMEYKEAPAFSFATGLLRGQTVFGEKFNLGKEVGQRFIPMVMQDIYDIAKDDPKLLPLSALGIFGMGLQTYAPKKQGAIY